MDSYFDDHSILFYKGRYFVMLYATEPYPSTMKELVLLVSSRILDPSPSPKEIRFFPTKGPKPGSIQYFSEGLLGHRFLKRGFQGTYIEDEEVKAEINVENQTKVDAKGKGGGEQKEFNLFLAIFKDTENTKKALKAYKDYLIKRGRVQAQTPPRFGANTLRGEDPYKGKVLVVQRGFYLIGIAGFEKEKPAEDSLAEMIKNVN